MHHTHAHRDQLELKKWYLTTSGHVLENREEDSNNSFNHIHDDFAPSVSHSYTLADSLQHIDHPW